MYSRTRVLSLIYPGIYQNRVVRTRLRMYIRTSTSPSTHTGSGQVSRERVSRMQVLAYSNFLQYVIKEEHPVDAVVKFSPPLISPLEGLIIKKYLDTIRICGVYPSCGCYNYYIYNYTLYRCAYVVYVSCT